MEKMKALVKAKPEVGIWMEEIPVPEVGHNDILIKVGKTAICGTDIHIYNWDAWAEKTIPVPMAVGHEFVGRIVEVGTHSQLMRANGLYRRLYQMQFRDDSAPAEDSE